MNLLLNIPFAAHLVLLFILGACMGGLANLGIYRLAWHPRRISPFSAADPKLPPRRLADRIPIVGWLGLRRESVLHGGGFWIRPMLLELLSGVGFAAMFWWEIGNQGLLLPNTPLPATPGIAAVLHACYAAHLVLISLMLVASMIDADEKTIPDSITVPGTLLGLLLAAACPWSLLPDMVPPNGPGPWFDFWNAASAETWQVLLPTSPEVPAAQWGFALRGWLPQGIRPFPQGWSLAVGLGCWWLWCLALMPRTWYSRHGTGRALRLCLARLTREPATYWLLGMGVLGSIVFAAIWFCGGTAWSGLFTAAVGMAAGGGLIWVVRLVGTAVLRREAMGFGDVTLMAMIGAFLGWQTCLIVFFLAPFAALAVGLIQLVVRRDNEIPYGPFLCLATLVTVVRWASIWNHLWPIFDLGWIVLMILLACTLLMAGLLILLRIVREAVRLILGTGRTP